MIALVKHQGTLATAEITDVIADSSSFLGNSTKKAKPVAVYANILGKKVRLERDSFITENSWLHATGQKIKKGKRK